MPTRDWQRFFICRAWPQRWRGRWLLFALALAAGFALSIIGLELAGPPARPLEQAAAPSRLGAPPKPSAIPLRPPGATATLPPASVDRPPPSSPTPPERSGVTVPLAPPPGGPPPSPFDAPGQGPLAPRSALPEAQPPMPLAPQSLVEPRGSEDAMASPAAEPPVTMLPPIVAPSTRQNPLGRNSSGAPPDTMGPIASRPIEAGLEAPAWRRHAVAMGDVAGKPMIAIVIDDMGLDQRRSAAAALLPGPLTLAFMPYGRDLARQTAAARAAGHELVVHVAMQPLSAANDPGPNALMVDLPPAEISRRLDWALASFDGYVGINNHMGSRFTTDRVGMDVVMAALKARGLLFLDSRTGQYSVGASAAAAHGVPYAARHIFIDNEISASEVGMQLAETERIARQTGLAVAIGHPHDVTTAALKEWLPSLAEKNFVLAPISAIVSHLEARRAVARSHSASAP